MKLFSSMKEFDQETQALWRLLDTNMSYESFLSKLATELGSNIYELRQNCKGKHRLARWGEEIDTVEVISKAVVGMGITADITRWAVRQVKSETSIDDIKGGAIFLKRLADENISTISGAYESLEEFYDIECNYVFIPVETIQNFELNLENCHDRHAKQFWKALSRSKNHETIKKVCVRILAKKDKQKWYPQLLDLITKNPFSLYEILLSASDDFRFFVADYYDHPHLHEHRDTEHLPAYCLERLFNSSHEGSGSLDYNTPLGFACGIQSLEKETGDEDPFRFGRRRYGWKSNPAIELDKFPALLVQHATSETIDTFVYIRACLLALLNSGHIDYFNASLKAIKNIISAEQFDELSAIGEFANLKDDQVNSNSFESRFLTHAALIRASTGKLESPEKVQLLFELVVANIQQGTLGLIPNILRRICPSLSDALIHESTIRDSLSFLLPAIDYAVFFDDEAIIKQMWKLACLTRNRQWVEILRPHVPEEYHPLQRLLITKSLQREVEVFDVKEISQNVDEAKFIISDILNPTKFWAQPDSAYYGTPKILALLYTLNELVIETRSFNQTTTFYENDEENYRHAEDVEFLSNAPGGESYENRIKLFVFLREYPGYEDLKPKCDVNFFYLYSQKQSEVIFVTSVGFDRLYGIAKELGARKMTFVNFSYNRVIMESITVPTMLHVLDSLDRRTEGDLYGDMYPRSMGFSLHRTTALKALKSAIDPSDLIFFIGDMSFKFGYGNNVHFNAMKSSTQAK
jgi:hypothetical protein